MAIDAKQLIAGWCGPTDDLQLTGERTEPETDFVLSLRSGGADIAASVATGADRLRLTSVVEASGAGSAADALGRLELQRPAPISLSATGDQVTIRTWIVLDGLTKHSFLSAVSEIARTREAVVRVVGGAAEAAEGAGMAAAPTAAATGASAASPWGPYAQSGYAGAGGYGGATPVGPLSGSGQGYGQPYGSPAPTQGQWTPAHKVPPQGMQAWAVPDPNSPVIANLGGHLPVQVTETRGAWARVVCSNGWTGWVDGRLLVAGP